MGIRTLIADDHNVFRKGLRELLEDDPNLEVVGEASDGFEVMEAFADGTDDVDVLVLDISMPGPPATRLAERILDEDPHFPIVVLTMHEEEYYLKEFLKIGVMGFLNKKTAADHVIQAIQAADAGRRFIDPELADKVVNPYLGRSRDDEESRLDQLTKRQTEVCRLLAYGHTNAEIADKLNISPRTVESHRAEIMKKMDFDNRAELVRFSLDNNLIGD